MKKWIVIGLLGAFSSAQLGTLAWYYGRTLIHTMSADWQQIRLNTMRSGKEISLVKIGRAAYRQNVKDGEIILNGILFDITKTAVSDTTLVLTLQKDELETYLLKQYAQIAVWINKHRHSRGSEQFVLNWMMKLYISSPGQIATSAHRSPPKNSNLSNAKNPSSIYFDVPGKPPDQAGINTF
jgi:hypothetical protein